MKIEEDVRSQCQREGNPVFPPGVRGSGEVTRERRSETIFLILTDSRRDPREYTERWIAGRGAE